MLKLIRGFLLLWLLGWGIIAQTQTLPEGLLPALVGAMVQDAGPRYKVVQRQRQRDYHAENPEHDWHIRFLKDSVRIGPESQEEPWEFTLRLVRFGTADQWQEASVESRTIAGNRVTYHRGVLDEWYVNGSLGLEQGFTIKAPPHPGAKALIFEQALGKDWVAESTGPGIKLVGTDKLLYYGALFAFDVQGRALPTQLVVADGLISIRVGVAGATYPVTIDPLLSEEAKLSASDAGGLDFFGSSVALADDGNTALVGAPESDCADGNNCGSAYVFVRNGSVWSEQEKLVAMDAAVLARFGDSVALADDGNTALVGASGDGGFGFGRGAAYVFVRDGNAWSQQQKLTGAPMRGFPTGFGVASALSADGNTALVGAPITDNAAYVFVRDGSDWSEPRRLAAADNLAFRFGISVALADDGDTALVGADLTNCSAGNTCGAGYVFVRNGVDWSEQQKLTASDEVPLSWFGGSVALADDGETALVGAPHCGNAFGAGGCVNGTAYVFVRDGSQWSERAKLDAPVPDERIGFGLSVALDDDGDTVLVGAPLEIACGPLACGAAYLYTRTGNAWRQQQKLTASDGGHGDGFGLVALTGDGNTVLVGASAVNCAAGLGCGAAYVFEVFMVSGLAEQLDDNWKSVSLPAAFLAPVVIAGPPTLHGGQPGLVRLRNVTGSGFETRFQEWLYLNEIHALEDVPFMILERDRHEMPDGSIWEAGTFSLGGTAVWQRQTFQQSFPGMPALFLTAQSFNGAQPVTMRARNVSASGFEAALFEEEALMDGHVAETVGYLAVFSPQGSGMVDVGGTQTPYVLQSVNVDHRLMPVLSSVVKLEEERSQDPEVTHTDERMDVLALGDTVFAQVVSHVGNDTVALRRVAPEHNARMEWGVVEGVTHGWTKVPLVKDYANAVVVARPVSNRGADPGVVQLRNVSGDSFELRYEEWAYLDGGHGAQERVFYLVAEAGSRVLAGLRVEAGTLDSATLLPVSFSTPFAERPALFTSVQSFAGVDPVTTRIVSASTSGFELAMQEEEAKTDGHTVETLGWIAIALGGGRTNDGRRVLVFEDAANDVPTLVSYGETLNRRFPVLVSDIASTLGTDAGFLRYQALGPSSVELFIAEEQSLDLETTHTFEDVSVFVAE